VPVEEGVFFNDTCSGELSLSLRRPATLAKIERFALEGFAGDLELMVSLLWVLPMLGVGLFARGFNVEAKLTVDGAVLRSDEEVSRLVVGLDDGVSLDDVWGLSS